MGIPDAYVFWGAGVLIFLCVAYSIWDHFPNFRSRHARKYRLRGMIRNYLKDPDWFNNQ